VQEELVYVYVVQKDGTLWDIAELVYGDPDRWRELYEANPDIVDPHYIYTGQLLKIPNFECESSRIEDCYEE
jgi:nucleoid-associated protein YgaU